MLHRKFTIFHESHDPKVIECDEIEFGTSMIRFVLINGKKKFLLHALPMEGIVDIQEHGMNEFMGISNTPVIRWDGTPVDSEFG